MSRIRINIRRLRVSADMLSRCLMLAPCWFAHRRTSNLIVYVTSENVHVTGTFKHRKVDLVAEGFNINKIVDAVYFRDDTNKTYIPLTPALYQDIETNTIRL
jgi:hypothetical protein